MGCTSGSIGLHPVPPDDRSRVFFDDWTRKEAIMQATGRGLVDFLNQIRVVSTTNEHVERIMIRDGMYATAWHVRALAPGSGYVGALAMPGQDWHPMYEEWV